VSNEPLDFGIRVAQREWGAVLINPMPMLARVAYEATRANATYRRRLANARKRPHRGGKR
jgi:hypothetical protein